MRDGGGLIVLGETEQDKYGNNLNELLARFHLHLANDTVQDYEHHLSAPTWILAALGAGERGGRGDVLARVDSVCLYRATTIASENGARVLARTHRTASTPDAPRDRRHRPRGGPGRRARRLRPVRGRLHRRARPSRAVAEPLLLGGAAAGARTRRPARNPILPGSGCARRRTRSPSSRPRTARCRRRPNGPRPTSRRSHEAIEALAPRFPHQHEYLAAVQADLRRWARVRLRPSPTSPQRSTRSAPSATAETAPSTWCSSRCTSRTPRATRAARP